MGDESSSGRGEFSTEIIVRCSPEWKRALRVRAAQRGMDLSKHVREILGDEMESAPGREERDVARREAEASD